MAAAAVTPAVANEAAFLGRGLVDVLDEAVCWVGLSEEVEGLEEVSPVIRGIERVRAPRPSLDSTGGEDEASKPRGEAAS
ncbi:hypothetical protein G6O67_007280 [Ophiocordyceps sinensis]|uniref:Uncharacterized protein n=1 Tax=Ophiocordyceps sinensis TaxID=72228 RepID=A0A8H4LTK8_9HYPO|nr:hypothetical protein G6O67_007280 [Ophiocordyceps sinensis]